MLALGGFAAGLLLLAGDRALQHYLESTAYNWARVLWCFGFGIAPFLLTLWLGLGAGIGFVVGGMVGWQLGPRGVQPRAPRGREAASKGWQLLDEDPDDTVPDEARRFSAIADEWAPYDGLTLLLRGVIALHDGELERAASVVAPVGDELPWRGAARDAIRAVVAHRRGDHAEAERLLAAARLLMPASDVLAAAEREVGGGSAMAGS